LKHSAAVKQSIVTLDMEGVLTPEIWIAVAEKTKIPELRRTTRDEPDYDKLMRGRLEILAAHRLGLPDIEAVIAGMEPLAGAGEFLEWLRARHPVVVLSDTFSEFAAPLMRQLGYPTLLCHRLEVAPGGRIAGYRIRLPDHKRKTVAALRQLNFRTIAAGDSYNDATMLAEADAGILFRPPENVVRDFPQFPVASTYEELRAACTAAAARLDASESPGARARTTSAP
jgi:phosphoserine/homoserine phosphotransferase